MNSDNIGDPKERISITISEDELKASVIFNLTDEELNAAYREVLKKEINALLNYNGIVYGINCDFLSNGIENSKNYTIAEGTPPTNGNDAIVTMYQLQETKPEIREDGSIDYYELKLINRVKAGDWLGERIEATDGHSGKSVKGATIVPEKGKTLQLNYDKNSVLEVSIQNKTILHSKINGAVHYNNGKISVSNHLDIDGNVGISTGNIKFDGYLTVKGTVCDGFSIEATKDIEINGEMGLGSIKSIISTEGSIYIKGGISAKGRVDIKSSKNVFIKFVDNANITCGGTAHIGYYCLNSSIYAKEVVLDASNGRILGGNTIAKIRVSAPIIGSESERKTIIEVTGFNRAELLESLDNIFHRISNLKNEQQKLKSIVSSFDMSKQIDQIQRKVYNEASDKLYAIREELKSLDEEKKNIAGYLKAHGEGEIVAAKKIYPNCTLILNKNIIEFTSEVLSPTFYIQEGVISQI